jgi:hypothetical protein
VASTRSSKAKEEEPTKAKEEATTRASKEDKAEEEGKADPPTPAAKARPTPTP